MTTLLEHALGGEPWRRANSEFLVLCRERVRLMLSRHIRLLSLRWGREDDTSASSESVPVSLAGVVISEAAVRRLLDSSRQDANPSWGDDPEVRATSLELDALELRVHQLVEYLECAKAPPAIDVLSGRLSLSRFEREVLLALACVECDRSLRRICAYAQDDTTLRRPTTGFLIDLLCSSDDEKADARLAFTGDGKLFNLGLVHRIEPTDELRSDPRISDFILGVDRLDERVSDVVMPIPVSGVVPSHESLVARLEHALHNPRRRSRWHGVNLIGSPESGRRELAAHVSSRLGLNLVRLDPARLPSDPAGRLELGRLLSRDTAISRLAVYVDLDEIDPSKDESSVSGWIERLKVFWFVGSEQRISLSRPILPVLVPKIDTDDRRQLWMSALEEAKLTVDGNLDALMEQFRLSPELVGQVVASASMQAQIRGTGISGRVSVAELWAACREQSNSRLSELAQPLTPCFSWDDIVLPHEVGAQLRELAAQVANRATVYNEWGFGRKLARGRGISALFSGVSGTGKTMAAEVLGAELRLDLFRIDLAGVVSKYIGETEKNLRRIFDAAERSGAILFFDEADALFGRRTDVKDSQDRFANIEVNYLLQRMEDYQGLSILATNRKTELDRAFLRRLRFLIDFPFPNATQRRLIWQKAFPAQTPVGELDYETLARMEVSGANIRNIAVGAAFLAASRQEPISMDHLTQAARREFHKIDKMVTEAELPRSVTSSLRK